MEIGGEGVLFVVTATLNERSGKHEGKFRIVGRLPRQDTPCTAVFEFPASVRVFTADFPSGLKLDKATERVTCKLAQKAALSPGENLVALDDPVA